MLGGGSRARFSRAAAFVVVGNCCLCLLSATAALAQDDAAPPSAVSEARAAEVADEKPAPVPDEEAAPAPEVKPAAKPAPKPIAKPAPKPAAKPAAKPPAPAAAPAAPSPSSSEKPKAAPPEIDPRTLQLERDVKAALTKEPPDPRRMEEICGAWQAKKVFDERPLLGALLPLCLARAAMLQNRDEHAVKKLEEALAALRSIPVDGDAIEVRAEALFRRAELAERALVSFKRCGADLGLRRLSSWEAREISRRLDHASAAYAEVMRAGARGWTRRALLRTGAMYDSFYRQVASSLPKTYIGVELPSPFHVEEHDGALLLEPALAPQAAAWPREIARVYDAVHAELVRAGDDAKLLAEVEQRRKAFADLGALPRERAVNPWLPDMRPGLLRRTQRGFEERTDEGTWRVLDEADARKRLDAALAGGVRDVSSAWALVALASAGIPVDTDVLEDALASDDERVRLSALIALAEHPQAELYEPLVTTWQKLGVGPEEPLFTSLQAALFGAKERALLALRALADRERDLAGKLADEPRLPPRVRAYLLAELGDNRLLPHYQKLATTNDRTTTAVALYGAYLAAGRRVVWNLRPTDPEPLGCVSRHLRAVEDETARQASQSELP